MRKPVDIVARVAEDAMIRNRLHSSRELAEAIGCGEKTAQKLLNAEQARLNQDQFIKLFQLGGFLIWTT